MSKISHSNYQERNSKGEFGLETICYYLNAWPLLVLLLDKRRLTLAIFI